MSTTTLLISQRGDLHVKKVPASGHNAPHLHHCVKVPLQHDLIIAVPVPLPDNGSAQLLHSVPPRLRYDNLKQKVVKFNEDHIT